MIELKKVLDENKNQLSDILCECQNGLPGQALLNEKMTPLLEEFGVIEEQLFKLTLDQKDQSQISDDG